MQHRNRIVRAGLAAALVAASLPARAQSKLLPPQQAQVALGSLPLRAMWALESNDVATLAKLAHSKGVRFSSGIFADKSDLTFTPSQIRGLKRRGPIRWGTYDGTGDPIRLDWAGFRRKFLWSRDFSVGKVSYNTFKSRGNTPNNLRQAYADAIFVESFVPGTKEFSGMDWGGLWMVWKREGGAWKLRGLACDYWTT